MPTFTETPIKAYAHCCNARCPGNRQVEVDAVLVTEAWFYHEQGGDGMFAHPERSTEQPRFLDPDTEGKCDLCGSNRDLSLVPRPQLDDSGYDPGALLDIAPDKRDPSAYGKGSPGGHAVIDDERTTALEAENRELREGLAELRGIMLGQQSQQPAPTEDEPEAEVEQED